MGYVIPSATFCAVAGTVSHAQNVQAGVVNSCQIRKVNGEKIATASHKIPSIVGLTRFAQHNKKENHSMA
jgi:hypothetical protein